MTEQGKKVWKELENMGWSNEPKDFHLEYFEDIIQAHKKAFSIHGVMQSAFAVIPDAERYLGGTNEVIAVFKHKEQAERFARALWKEYYIIEEVQSPHFA